MFKLQVKAIFCKISIIYENDVVWQACLIESIILYTWYTASRNNNMLFVYCQDWAIHIACFALWRTEKAIKWATTATRSKRECYDNSSKNRTWKWRKSRWEHWTPNGINILNCKCFTTMFISLWVQICGRYGNNECLNSESNTEVKIPENLFLVR